jgi:hypothetical protein
MAIVKMEKSISPQYKVNRGRNIKAADRSTAFKLLTFNFILYPKYAFSALL